MHVTMEFRTPPLSTCTANNSSVRLAQSTSPSRIEQLKREQYKLGINKKGRGLILQLRPSCGAPQAKRGSRGREHRRRRGEGSASPPTRRPSTTPIWILPPRRPPLNRFSVRSFPSCALFCLPHRCFACSDSTDSVVLSQRLGFGFLLVREYGVPPESFFVICIRFSSSCVTQHSIVSIRMARLVSRNFGEERGPAPEIRW
jgi:hypothetical protein